MEERKTEMQRVFDEYNKAGEVPIGGFTKKQLKTHPKSKAILRMIKLVEGHIRNDASEIFNEFNVNFKYSSSDNTNLSESSINAMAFEFDDVNKKNLTVSINFNFSKLGKLGDSEIYSVVYNTMYSSLLKKKELVSSDNKFKFGKQDELQDNVESAVNDANFDREGNYVEHKNSIIEYIKAFLKTFFGFEESSIDGLDAKAVSNFGNSEDYIQCANRIARNFSKNNISSQDIFENPNGKNLIAERYGKISKLGYNQQATNLLGIFSQNEFNALKSNDNGKIMSFCEQYVKTVLKQNHVDERNVVVTFNPTGSIGEYLDYGNRQEININLEAVKKINNPAEVIMTLQHELTHVIDSSANKQVNNVTREGYGLLDNLVGGTNVSDLSITDMVDGKDEKSFAQATNFVKKLKEICYRINPNERSARIGELSAIKFMQGLNSDKSMNDYIEKSIDSYKRYQDKVLRAIEQAPQMRSEFEHSFKSIIKDGSQTKKLIDNMLDYIDSLNLNLYDEKEAIAIAMQTKKDLHSNENGDQGITLE